MISFFLFSLTSAADYAKTICICKPSKCVKNNAKCDNQPILDPLAPSFYDDFTIARKNIKDITVVFNQQEILDVTLDMRIISGLNIDFRSYKGDVKVYFPYTNSEDYSGNNLEFDKYCEAHFIPRSDGSAKTNKFIFGSILIQSSLIHFYKNGAVNTELRCESIYLKDTSAFLNISAISKSRSGPITFALMTSDVFELKISKSSSAIVINDNTIGFYYFKEDVITFIGKASSYKTNEILKIRIDEGLSILDAPVLNFTEIGNLEFACKLWKPSDEHPTQTLDRCYQITVPPGDFPYNIYTNNIDLVVSGDTTFYGIIDSYSFEKSTANMNIYDPTNKTCKLLFKGSVDSFVYPRSPFLDIEIDNYSSYASSPFSQYPIGVCFNEETASHVKVHKVAFSQGSSVIYSGAIPAFCNIERVIDDEILDQTPMFKNGLAFLEIPKDSLDSNIIRLPIQAQSPSNLLKIPGFTIDDNCLGTLQDKSSESLKILIKKVRTAFDMPTYICITVSDLAQCTKPTGYPYYYYPYTNIESIGDGNVADFVNSAYTKIVIGTTYIENDITLNFEALPKFNYDITLVGKGSEYSCSQFVIKASPGKIENISIETARITESCDFKMKYVSFKNTYFNTGTYTFDEATYLKSDLISFQSLQATNRNIAVNYLYLVNYENMNSATDLFKVFNNNMEICIEKWGTKNYCVEVLSNNVKGLNFKSDRNSIFTIDSINKDFIPVIIEATVSNYAVTLEGDGWFTDLKNKIVYDHSKNKIEVKVTAPFQAGNIILKGTGSALYKVEYKNKKEFCIYNETSKQTCNTGYATNLILNDGNIAEEINNISEISISLTADYSEYPVPLRNSIFDLRQVEVSASESNLRPTFQIDFDVDYINPFYSLASFDSLDLSLSEAKQATFQLGQLVITKKIFTSDEWKQNIDLNVSQLTCDFSDLYQFKKVYISDQLTLSGSIPDDERPLAIDFKQDQDANDLVAPLYMDAKIFIGPNYIKLNNKITFNIQHSDNYDALFNAQDDILITIECDSSVTKQTFPKLSFYSEYHDVNYELIGNFPELDPEEESLIHIEGKSNVIFTLNGNAPISLSSFTFIKFFCNANDIQIQGPLDYKSTYSNKNTPVYTFYNNASTLSNIKVVRGFKCIDVTDTSTILGVMSPNIQLTVEEITNEQSNRKTEIVFVSTIGNVSSSRIIVNQLLPEGFTYSSSTKIVSTLVGKITDESTFPFISSNVTIISAPARDLVENVFEFSYIIDDSITQRTHGFYFTMNCLGINTVNLNQIIEVQLFAEINPSQIPFVIDIIEAGTNTNGELVIDQDHLSDLLQIQQLLPEKFVGIIIRLYAGTKSSYPIDLVPLVAGRNELSINLYSVGYTAFDIYITPPNSPILNLTFKNLIIGVAAKEQTNLVASHISFTDCEFKNANIFKITSDNVDSLTVDVDSLNELLKEGSLKTFNKVFTIQAANVVSFNKEGWEFKENYAKDGWPIKATEFSHVIFEAGKSCMLQIKEEDMTSIHGFTLNAYPADDTILYMEMSRHWGNIKELNGFKVEIHGATGVSLNSASYPIPVQIFDIDPNLITYQFETDLHGKFDTIQLEDGKVYDGEVFTADFTLLPDEYRYVKGNRVSFKGINEFNFRNDLGTVQLNDATFLAYTDDNFSNLEILSQITISKGARLTGSFKYSPSSAATLHWTIDSPPLMKYKTFISGAPNSLEVIYDDTTVDKEKYRELMLNGNGLIIMKGDFECFKMKRNVTFGGSYKPFGNGNSHISIECDSSSEGNVLLILGQKDITDDDDGQTGGGGNGAKISNGGIAGIVIGCAVVASAVGAFIVYFIQRIKIDKLKNEIPYENNSAFQSSKGESTESTDPTRPETDPFDD